MSLYGLQRGFYSYVSDNGTTYTVAITADQASAGSFAGPVNPSLNPALPRGWKMRRVYGVGGGFRTSTPVGAPTISLYTSGGTFNKHGQAFTSQGIRGEQRYTRS